MTNQAAGIRGGGEVDQGNVVLMVTIFELFMFLFKKKLNGDDGEDDHGEIGDLLYRPAIDPAIIDASREM